MKKVTLLLAVLFTAISLISCEKDKDDDSSNNNNNNNNNPTDIRDQYIGTYMVIDSTFNPGGNVHVENIPIEISKDSLDANKIYFKGFFELTELHYATLTDSVNFTIPVQEVEPGMGTNFYGSGRFENNKVHYRIDMSNFPTYNIGHGTKQ